MSSVSSWSNFEKRFCLYLATHMTTPGIPWQPLTTIKKLCVACIKVFGTFRGVF